MSHAASTSRLYAPIKVGDMELKQRIALPPLTRMRAPNHVVTDLQPQYYGQRAHAPGTLLISEATFISAAAGGYPSAPGIWNKEQTQAWSKVIKAVHDKKSFFFVQLWALGRSAFKSDLDSNGLPYVSASDVPESVNNPDSPKPRPLTKDEIKQYVKDYVNAAKNAIEAGADGVEIHSANGYLLDQFLHENTNHRTDEYGGSIENRARFLFEVVDALIETVGANRLAVRISPWGTLGELELGVSPLPQFSYVVAELEKRALAGNGIAYLSLVEPRFVFQKDFTTAEASGDNTFVRTIFTGVIVKASGYEKKSAEKEADEDDKVVVAVGRHFIANPDLVGRWKYDLELNPYNRHTFYTSGPEGYIDYPFSEELKKLEN